MMVSAFLPATHMKMCGNIDICDIKGMQKCWQDVNITILIHICKIQRHIHTNQGQTLTSHGIMWNYIFTYINLWIRTYEWMYACTGIVAFCTYKKESCKCVVWACLLESTKSPLCSLSCEPTVALAPSSLSSLAVVVFVVVFCMLLLRAVECSCAWILMLLRVSWRRC